MAVGRSPGAAGPPVIEPVEPVAESVGLVVPPEPFKNAGAIGRPPCAADPPTAPANGEPLIGPPGSPVGPWLFKDGTEVGRLPGDPVAERHEPPVLPEAFQDGGAIVWLPEPIDSPAGPVSWGPAAGPLGPPI